MKAARLASRHLSKTSGIVLIDSSPFGTCPFDDGGMNGFGFLELGNTVLFLPLHDRIEVFVPPAGKMVLSALMILGRLEILTVLALLIPSFWRR